jgi:hypothetical protein
VFHNVPQFNGHICLPSVLRTIQIYNPSKARLTGAYLL